MSMNEEFVVFIHSDDVERIHMLPNLFRLKQMEKVSSRSLLPLSYDATLRGSH